MPRTKALYDHYYSFVKDYPNNVVFNDLKERHYDRTARDLAEDEILCGIPHPYRQYVIMGQRMVIESILESVRVVESGELDKYLKENEDG